MSVPGPSIEQIKAGMRATWMAGDFGVIAKTIADVAVEFAERLNLPPGSRVLDVATGTGNVALPLARAGHTVTGADIATNLLEQAEQRAAAEGLTIVFEEGDAERLPYADASFDAVTTMFGAMFAPRPALVAAELARVLKPGGLLAMANWNPASFTGAMFRTGAKYVPPPPGVPPALLWGVEEEVQARLGADFHPIHLQRIPISFDLQMPPDKVVDLFRSYFGPTKMTFERLDEEGQEALRQELVELWSAANRSDEPAIATSVPNEYLEVHAIRR